MVQFISLGNEQKTRKILIIVSPLFPQLQFLHHLFLKGIIKYFRATMSLKDGKISNSELAVISATFSWIKR